MAITRHRINITFYIQRRARAIWVIDAFKQDGNTVAVRCYQCTIHGGHQRLQDGWLVRDEARIQSKRVEIAGIMKGNNVRVEREGPSDHDGGQTIHTVNDIRL